MAASGNLQVYRAYLHFTMASLAAAEDSCSFPLFHVLCVESDGPFFDYQGSVDVTDDSLVLYLSFCFVFPSPFPLSFHTLCQFHLLSHSELPDNEKHLRPTKVLHG